MKLFQKFFSRTSAAQIDKKQQTDSEQLTYSVVKRLIGHTNVVFYNCKTNTRNTDTYNGYRMHPQWTETKRVKEFKSAMEQIPEFNQHYEFVASVTMTIDKAFFPGQRKLVSNPEYNRDGTAIVGNIIARNKQTGKHELYCKSWVGVRDFDDPDDAACDGTWLFAFYGDINCVFRDTVLAAHTR